MPDLALIVTLLQLAAKDRTQLVLENIALRHQLAVYKRSVKRPNLNDRDRIFWLTVMRMLRECRQALVFVQPDHFIPLSKKHMLRTVREFASYCNGSRTHQSLGGYSPIARKIESIGEAVGEPVLGGLHHRYSRAG